MNVNRFVFGASCLLLLAVGLWLPASTLAAPASLPSRATPTPTAAPSAHLQSGTIILCVPTLRADLWAIVQWQDGLGQWHNVEGWRGPLGALSSAERWQVWAVDPEQLGLGPFRWMVYSAPGGQLYADTEAFYLPKGKGDTLWVNAPNSATSPTAIPRQ